MEGTLAGRDALLDEAWTALRAPGSGLLVGSAGIGKTALFRALIRRAEADGVLVLRCAPTEAESDLPLAALADLLQPLADRVAELPEQQRIAASTVLLADGAASTLDERALAVATRALIDAAASSDGGAGRDVLVAIDDATWLDAPSERALRFALRRVVPSVAILVTCRTTDADDEVVPLGLGAASGTADLRPTARFALGPLGVGPLYHLLTERFGMTLSRPFVTRIAAASGGNPLLAIELVRAALRLPSLPASGDDLPVPRSMQDLVAATMHVLPDQSVHAVRLASLSTGPSLDELARAGVERDAMDAVEDAGLVRVTADARIVFVHATHAEAVRGGIPSALRRRLHAALASVVADPDERARHLARAVTEPDEHVASELADAAGRARRHGAPELAADLYDRAAALTPHQLADERDPRRLDAIRCRYDSGDFADAAARAERLAAELHGDRRADALLVRAAIAWSADDSADAIDAATRALESAASDSPLRGRIHAHLAVFVDSPVDARRHAEAALELLPPSGQIQEGDPAGRPDGILAQNDRSLVASALLSLFYSEVRSGEPVREELLTQALRLEGGEPVWLSGTIPAIWWKARDEHDQAIERLRSMLDSATALGDEPFQHELISHLSEAEMYAGHYDVARGWSAKALELGEQLSTGLAAENWLAAMIDVHRGELEAATGAAQLGLQLAADTGDPWCRRVNLCLDGFAALADGRAADAAESFGALARALDEIGLVEALGARFEADWVEACVAIGDLDTAAAAQERLLGRHRRVPRPWTSLGLARGAVLLAAAKGLPTEGVLDELTAAREAVPPEVNPFERARCLLVAGITHRRARRKRAARDALDAAAAEFDALGALLRRAGASRSDAHRRASGEHAGADDDRGTGREHGRARCHEPHHRRRDVRDVEDGRGQPLAGLSQARHLAAGRARHGNGRAET